MQKNYYIEHGFITNSRKIDNYNIEKIIEKTYQYNIQIDILCTDFQQTLGGIYRHKLIEILQPKEYPLNA